MNRRIWWTLLFVLALVGGTSLVLIRTSREVRRAEYLTRLPEWSSDTPAADPATATGYQAEERFSLVPGHNKQSFDLIALTQQMLARQEFRVGPVDYENTPKGHPGQVASPSAWMLAAAASMQRQLSGRPLGQCVETAALLLDPGLLLLGLIAASLLTAGIFGRLPAALLAIGMASMFPFAAIFVAGAPHPLSLHALCLLFSLLALLAGTDAARRLAAAEPADGRKRPVVSARLYFAASGVFGALGLWLDVPAALPFIGGIAASGCVLPFFFRSAGGQTLPWRAWGIAGASVVVLGYLTDYFPPRGEGALHYLHPLYALAWIGTAEIIVQCGRIGRLAEPWSRRRLATTAVAAIALLSLPVALFCTQANLYTLDGPDAFRLNPVSNIAAASLSGWLAQDGFSPTAVATLLPLLLLPLAAFFMYRVDAARRVGIGLAFGPVLLCLLVGSRQLSYWGHLDVALLALGVALAAALGEPAHWRSALVIAGVFVLCLTPGLTQLLKPNPADAELSTPDFENYVERDLAHWLRQHSTKKPAILAPPRVTSALCFYGGLAGLSTFDRENKAGTAAAIRIVSASSVEEALTLITSRQLTHIIVPFWDTYLNEYLRLGFGANAENDRLEGSFFAKLQHWELPPWLRAIPYPLPPGPGVDGQAVILEIVNEQPPAVAAARLGEYFLEMDQPDKAREQARELTKYPNDWSALAATCMIAATAQNASGLETARDKLLSAVSRPERRPLVWDRRVSLAIVLAQQKRPDLARPQIEKCLADIDADKLRSLTTVSLYRFDLLCKLYGLEISDPGLRALSRTLLRPDLRSRL